MPKSALKIQRFQKSYIFLPTWPKILGWRPNSLLSQWTHYQLAVFSMLGLPENHANILMVPQRELSLKLDIARVQKHCTALHCTTLHCTALHYITLHYSAVHCSALHWTALYCTLLHYTALFCGLFPLGVHSYDPADLEVRTWQEFNF